MNKLKALILDIETSPLVVLVWDVKDQYIPHENVLKDWDIMAWSAKWLGAPDSSQVYYDRRNGLSDKQILKPLWKLLDEADIVITQNGKAFDSKKIAARFMFHGVLPPSPYMHHDTYLIAKNAAAFTSHSLEYLAKALKTERKKSSHKKYPGMSLWKECMGLKIIERPWKNPKAWDEMKKYNMRDVQTTEDVYNKVKAWSPSNVARMCIAPSKCRMCGSDTVKWGTTVKNKTPVQRLRCKSQTCGAWNFELFQKKGKA